MSSGRPAWSTQSPVATLRRAHASVEDVLSLICRLFFARAPGGAGGKPGEVLVQPRAPLSCLSGPPSFFVPRFRLRDFVFFRVVLVCHSATLLKATCIGPTDRPTPAASPWIAAFFTKHIIRSSVHLTCKCFRLHELTLPQIYPFVLAINLLSAQDSLGSVIIIISLFS